MVVLVIGSTGDWEIICKANYFSLDSPSIHYLHPGLFVII